MSRYSRVAVLGSTSFSASDFSDLLLETQRYQILGISRSLESSQVMLKHLRHGNERYTFEKVHVFNEAERLMEIFDEFKPQYVVNFAAQGEVGTSFVHPVNHFQTNTMAVVQLTEELNKREYLKKYVQISTPEVYGTCSISTPESNEVFNPSSPYAASKAAADFYTNILHRTSGFPVCWVRATNVYGPRQQLYRIIPRTIIYVKLGKVLTLDGGGVAQKSFINIRDVSTAERLIMERGEPGEVYHLSPDQTVSVRSVVETVCAVMGACFEKHVEVGPERIGQDARYELSSEKMRQALGWKPQISFEEGVREVIQWVDDNWAFIQNMNLSYNFHL